MGARVAPGSACDQAQRSRRRPTQQSTAAASVAGQPAPWGSSAGRPQPQARARDRLEGDTAGSRGGGGAATFSGGVAPPVAGGASSSQTQGPVPWKPQASITLPP